MNNGADMSIRDKNGETPLDLAYKMENTDAIRILESLTDREPSG